MPHIPRFGQGVGKRLRQRKFARTTRIQAGLVAFLLGLWLSGQGSTMPPTLLVIGLAVIWLTFSKRWVGLLAAAFLGICLGFVRGQTVLVQTSAYDELTGIEVQLSGVVADESVYNRFGQREFDIEQVTYEGVQLPGRVSVSGFGISSVQRGDKVTVSGKLRDGFGSRSATMNFAEVEVTSHSGTPLMQLRKHFFASTLSGISEPQASLGLGFLVGGRTLLPEGLLAALSITGLTHIVAVSGYNLTILVRLTRRLLARISVFQATAGSLALISMFLAVTGLSPSIFRASVVTVLALSAWYFGRTVGPMMLLLLSGAITAGIRPHYLWSDLGWWLSFLAFFGVLILAPLVTARIYKGKKPGTIMQIVIETSCAQLLTMPLIGMVFGEFSLIAIAANALILPLIPLAMLLTFIAGVSGMLLPAVVGWFAWPARLILELITSLVTLLSHVPHALLAVELNVIEMLSIYGGIGAVTFILWSRNKLGAAALRRSNVIE